MIHTGNISIEGDFYTRGRKVATNDSCGAYYFVTSSATVLTSGIWKKIAGTTVIHYASTFTMSQNNRLLYTSSLGRFFNAECAISVNLSQKDTSVSIAFCVNGQIVSSSIGSQFHKVVGESSRGTYISLLNLSYGDYVEMWAKTNVGCNLDVTNAYICLTPA